LVSGASCHCRLLTDHLLSLFHRTLACIENAKTAKMLLRKWGSQSAVGMLLAATRRILNIDLAIFRIHLISSEGFYLNIFHMLKDIFQSFQSWW
jgi:hypothetical protein